MCGIAGFTWNDENLIKEMMKKIKHRGPDDEGTYFDEKVTLGHVRLSILDLSPKGHQPMISKDGNLIIVHNGEIYNYKEIREELKKKGYSFISDTDTEVIIYSYMEWGPECVKKFNGMWAFVIYDKTKDTLFISRDRFGIKPLYYHIDVRGNIIFASEIKAILSYKKKWEPNDLAIFDYLVYNLTDHDNFTFFKEIYKFPKAHYATFDLKSNTLNIKKYWSIKDIKIKKEDFKKSTMTLEKLLYNSVKLRLRSDVPVGSCLSGGVDSSSIVSIMSTLTDPSKINTFSAVYPGFEKNEEKYINFIIEKLNINNSKITPNSHILLEDIKKYIYHLEEPTRCTSQYSQYNVMKLAAKHNYNVLLDGQGSDELFGGYPYFYGYYMYDLLRKLSLGKLLSVYKKCKKALPDKKAIHSFYFLLTPMFIKKRYLRKRAWFLKDDFYKQFSKKSKVFEKILNVKKLKDAIFVHVEYKLEELLKWEDRNAMAFAIETRVPFLDHNFVEYALSLPDDYILNNCYTKYILRRSMEKYVPNEIIYRRDKVGFETPEAEWLRDPLIKEFVEKLLYSDKFKRRKYWDINKVHEMWDAHQKGKNDYSLQIWKIIFVEVWYRIFFEGEHYVTKQIN